MDHTEQEKILTFWFGSPWDQKKVDSQIIQNWFKKDENFDQTIRGQFYQMWEQYQHETDRLDTDSKSCLASIILFDQFPRNMFRNDPRAFSTDNLARKISLPSIKKEFDKSLSPHQKCFVYLPLEHSEELEDQNRCVALFQESLKHAEPKDKKTWGNYLSYALKHREVIQNFGRFPHRNSVLSRSNTAEEEAYLAKPGAGF